MAMPLALQVPVQAHEHLCQQQFINLSSWLAMIAGVVLLAFYLDSEVIALSEVSVELLVVALVAVLPLLLVAGLKSREFYGSKGQLAEYRLIQQRLEQANHESSPELIQQTISEAELKARSNYLIPNLLEHYEPVLYARMKTLHQQALRQALNEEFNALKKSCGSKINTIAEQVPLIKANFQIRSSLNFLTRRRQQMHDQWEAAYVGFSLYNKMKYALGPDFSEIDKAIDELTSLQQKLDNEHAEDLEKLTQHFELLEQRAIARMSSAKIKAEQFIQDGRYQDDYSGSMLNKALLLSALSVPVSAWIDIDQAMDVYDALRGVNGDFAGMSDAEIWWESLLMPTESLAGLAALTKGAYFEQLVAADTGGQLHEHFNHPDTDIVIDGIAFQIKATSSAPYVSSVDESIPVISTDEVALATGSISSGYSDEALTSTISDALGGTVIDVGDTAADAILTGIGGLGLFATLQGINHASSKYENGGDAVEAVFEGAGVAIEGTARAFVGAVEMGYNILNSKPSRFLGRVLVKGAVKLEQKLFDEPKKK